MGLVATRLWKAEREAESKGAGGKGKGKHWRRGIAGEKSFAWGFDLAKSEGRGKGMVMNSPKEMLTGVLAEAKEVAVVLRFIKGGTAFGMIAGEGEKPEEGGLLPEVGATH